VEVIYSIEALAGQGITTRSRGRNLRIGQVRGQAQPSEQRSYGRVAIEKSRERNVLKHADRRAAESRNVPCHSHPEVVIENAPAGTQYSFGVWGPGHTYTRRQVGPVWKLCVVVPAESSIEREVASNFPVILKKQAVITVPQPDVVLIRRLTGL